MLPVRKMLYSWGQRKLFGNCRTCRITLGGCSTTAGAARPFEGLAELRFNFKGAYTGTRLNRCNLADLAAATLQNKFQAAHKRRPHDK